MPEIAGGMITRMPVGGLKGICFRRRQITGGWKRLAFDDMNQHGMEGFRFWTKTKTVTQRWSHGSAAGENAFVNPATG